MSRGLGFLERKIVNMLRYGRGRRSYRTAHLWLNADDIAGRAYPQERGTYWARHVAVLRAMRSVASKYPDKFVLRGGTGRAELVIMPVKYAPEWDETYPRRSAQRQRWPRAGVACVRARLTLK